MFKKISCLIVVVLFCVCLAGCSSTPKTLNGRTYQFLGFVYLIKEDTPEYFREKIEKKLQQDGDLDIYEGETLEQYLAECSKNATERFFEGIRGVYMSFAEDKVSLFAYTDNGEKMDKDGWVRYVIKENKLYVEESSEYYALKGNFLYQETSADFFDPYDDESDLLNRYIVSRTIFAEIYQ